MRVNVYAEEQTDLVDIISKKDDKGNLFTGVRFWLHLPVTEKFPKDGPAPEHIVQHKGPFMHHPDDDDSSAVTFWGKHDLRTALRKALKKLDEHYFQRDFGYPSFMEGSKVGGVVEEVVSDGFPAAGSFDDVELRIKCLNSAGGNLTNAMQFYTWITGRKA
jgi:hypothetical protein